MRQDVQVIEKSSLLRPGCQVLKRDSLSRPDPQSLSQQALREPSGFPAGKSRTFGTPIANIKNHATDTGVAVVINGHSREELMMKIAEKTARDSVSSELDITTIRRRVAQIKNQWTPEVAKARAEEGARRRRELDLLVTQLLGDIRGEFPFDERGQGRDAHGLTLVG